MRVAVAGGTGAVGRHVVRELERTGQDAVVLSRSSGVDLTTGEGLVERLKGCDAIIDVSNKMVLGEKAAVEFFGTVTRNLLDAGVRAGAGHLVALSIVGVDLVDTGYYKGKRRQEELVSGGPLPWTVLRATQFHEFPEPLIDQARGPFVVVPKMLSRPVATADVAARLVELVSGPAGGFVLPIAGPAQWRMEEMAKRIAKARGDRKLLIPVKLPGKVGKAMTGGALVPQGPFTEAPRTFEEHLADLEARVSSRR
ncbi:SDR family oxidoreductase [Lentzea cavernae]|uniref:3-beta hydroxysteroid dehydrogenase n=1 Tax=Lentzea cavernae TaxID=2020703 RepID=A0ABQ3M3J8_9PSEU|nr:NAD(P)H-binding protein [Lentzea cavernae]GHH32071.1 3-beta hydroxysteroid dehydrogenase [Lentzea cavernae]